VIIPAALDHEFGRFEIGRENNVKTSILIHFEYPKFRNLPGSKTIWAYDIDREISDLVYKDLKNWQR